MRSGFAVTIGMLATVVAGACASVGVSAAGSVTWIEARFDVAPAHVLPGLPAMFTLALSNRDTAPHSVANILRLRATPSSAPGFIVLWGGVAEGVSIPFTDDIVLLAPSQTREFYFPANEVLALNEAFWDERLTIPGTYYLQMELGDGFDVLTNTVRLVVDQPAGDDLAVWQLMQKKTGGGWPVERWSFGDTPAPQFPHSTYARATLFLWLMPRTQLRAALPAALDALSGPTRDDLRLLLISLTKSAAAEAFHSGDRKTGNGLTKQAQKQIEQLKHEAATGYAAAQADEALAKITAEIAIRDADPNERPRFHKLLPLAPCRAGDGALMFGYQNDNDWPIVNYAGTDNHFDPAPADRGQVIIFQPGRHKKAFTVARLPNEALKWILDGNTAALSADAKKCAEGDDDHN